MLLLALGLPTLCKRNRGKKSKFGTPPSESAFAI
jgi:hypothetical protein